MKRLIIIPLVLIGGCNDPPRTAFAFPVLPDLSGEVLKPCPPAEMVTGQLGDLASEDVALAVEYARCKQRKETAVAAYQDAQRLLKLATDQAAAITGVGD